MNIEDVNSYFGNCELVIEFTIPSVFYVIIKLIVTIVLRREVELNFEFYVANEMNYSNVGILNEKFEGAFRR